MNAEPDHVTVLPGRDVSSPDEVARRQGRVTARQELILVIPVHNEEGCVESTVRTWHGILNGLGIRFRLLLLNDGSTDRTKDILDALTDIPELDVVHKSGEGHGPTVLAGYQRVVDRADWIFNADGDSEIRPDFFPVLWEKRNEYDALFGERVDDPRQFYRRYVTRFASRATRLAFGQGVVDTNVPFRLIRSEVLKEALATMPDRPLSANVLLSAFLNLRGYRIHNEPVTSDVRQTGEGCNTLHKIIPASAKAFMELIRYRLTLSR